MTDPLDERGVEALQAERDTWRHRCLFEQKFTEEMRVERDAALARVALLSEALREVADMASKLRDPQPIDPRVPYRMRMHNGLIDIESHAIGSLAEAPPKTDSATGAG